MITDRSYHTTGSAAIPTDRRMPIETDRQRGVDPAQYVSVGNPVLPDFVRFAGWTLVCVRSDSRSALPALHDDC